ncbi:uncharacterized protein LOC112549808 isoform X2 [Alligator sinensis]|uniref:Uncharacterized protein LOC112549808 isoform X2 n=1 Tax=Alligator sinensis TaxID=38654 RepID=A0A3Q0GA61_ALLSI|nr:uncharacterized protein LOC112549808 isoform X2 [Alligator sinensis]
MRAMQSCLETFKQKKGKIMVLCVAAPLQKKVQLVQAMKRSSHKCLYRDKPKVKLWENQREEIYGEEEIYDVPGAETPPYVPAQREEPSQAFPAPREKLSQVFPVVITHSRTQGENPRTELHSFICAKSKNIQKEHECKPGKPVIDWLLQMYSEGAFAISVNRAKAAQMVLCPDLQLNQFARSDENHFVTLFSAALQATAASYGNIEEELNPASWACANLKEALHYLYLLSLTEIIRTAVWTHMPDAEVVTALLWRRFCWQPPTKCTSALLALEPDAVNHPICISDSTDWKGEKGTPYQVIRVGGTRRPGHLVRATFVLPNGSKLLSHHYQP